jgi:hypothetical protein
MPWGAVAAAVVGAYSASQSNKAAKKGADGQAAASQAAIDEQRRQFDLTRSDQAPWLAAGTDALGKQGAFLNGDWSGFMNSPDYKYALSQGLDTIDHRAAANGGLFGGGNTRDAIRFGSGLATQNADNYWSKLAGLSGTGSQTAQNLGALGANMATNIGNQYTNAANARASAYGQVANNNSQFAAGLGGAFNNWYQQNSARNGGGTGFYFGNNPGKG